jgi:hypothetical protein
MSIFVSASFLAVYLISFKKKSVTNNSGDLELVSSELFCSDLSFSTL